MVVNSNIVKHSGNIVKEAVVYIPVSCCTREKVSGECDRKL